MYNITSTCTPCVSSVALMSFFPFSSLFLRRARVKFTLHSPGDFFIRPKQNRENTSFTCLWECELFFSGIVRGTTRKKQSRCACHSNGTRHGNGRPDLVRAVLSFTNALSSPAMESGLNKIFLKSYGLSSIM